MYHTSTVYEGTSPNKVLIVLIYQLHSFTCTSKVHTTDTSYMFDEIHEILCAPAVR